MTEADMILNQSQLIMKCNLFCEKLLDDNSKLRQERHVLYTEKLRDERLLQSLNMKLTALKQELSNAQHGRVLGVSPVPNRKVPVGVDRQRAKVATRSRKSV